MAADQPQPPTDLKAAYKTIMDDHFPEDMAITFGVGSHRQTVIYEKVTWVVGDTIKGLRYGENPGQEAALYKLVNGNLVLGGVQTLEPGKWLISDAELLQFGKHPGKTNLTDVDNALNILRYMTEKPTVAIMKHNNPCGVAMKKSLAEAYHAANMADRIAAFGGAIVLNRAVDTETAQLIAKNYAEVVAAPEYEPGAMDILAARKNLRIMKISAIDRLQQYAGARVFDLKSLMDGGIIAQWSFVPEARTLENVMGLPLGYVKAKDGSMTEVARKPTPQEYSDMWFGWIVEVGVTSNSVLYVKDGVTVGIGTGEQDRVGVAEIARDKAYRKLADRIAWERFRKPYAEIGDDSVKLGIDDEVAARKGGLIGATMVSDAFFPFRDGVEVGLREGVTSVIQPGGSERDLDTIAACNEAGATMIFTRQRSFKH